jgi:fructan beta-fructosidase
MKYKIIILYLFVFQLAYSQEVIEIKERMKARFSPQSDWHSVVMMEDLNVEGDNGMTWRNYSESYMIAIEFEPNGASEFGVKVLLKEKLNQEVIVGYQLNNEQLYINSINAGKADFANALGMFVTPMKIDRGRVKMQVFVDKNSVEVFGNESEASVMSKAFPEENSTDWQIFSNGRAKVTKLTVWELRK